MEVFPGKQIQTAPLHLHRTQSTKPLRIRRASDGLLFAYEKVRGTTLFGIYRGSGSPEGVVTAPQGSMYIDYNGDWYQKKTGTGNTGWILK